MRGIFTMDKNLSLILVNQELIERKQQFLKISRISLRVMFIFSLIILISAVVG